MNASLDESPADPSIPIAEYERVVRQNKQFNAKLIKFDGKIKHLRKQRDGFQGAFRESIAELKSAKVIIL